MAKNMMLTLGVSIAAAGAFTAISKLSKSTEKFNETYKKLDENMKKFKAEEQKIKNLDKLKKSYISVGKEWIQAVTKLRNLKDGYAKTGKSNIELSKKIKEQERIVKTLNKQKERQKHLFKEARSEIEREYGTLKKYGEQLEKNSKSLEKQNKIKEKMEKYGERIDKYNKYSSIAAKGLASLTIPLKVYMDVEEAQADLRKMLDDEAVKYYDKLSEISNNSPLSQVEVYEIAGALAQSGIKGDEIVEFTDKAQKLKIAFDMSTESAGEFLAKTKEQLGLTKEEVFAFADSINYMADNTASSASQLVEFSQRIGGVAKTIGVTKEANVALGATLISMGKAPEIAATGIKQLYLELGKGADTKKKLAAFNYLGVDADKLSQDMVKDAEGTIVKVLEKINKLNQADKAAVLNDLFGEQAIDSVATLANNTDKLRENLEKVKSEMSNGAVEREYQNRMQTLSNQLKLVKNQFMNSLAELGEALAPLVKDFLEALIPILKNMATFVRENPKIVKIIMSFTTFSLILGAVGFKMFALYNKFKKIKAALVLAKEIGTIGKFGSILFNTFSKIIGVIKIVGIAIKTAFLANPLGVIIIAIISVIGILTVLYKKNEKFRNFVNNMWKNISNWAVSAWNIISSKAIGVYNGLKNGWDVFVNFFKTSIENVVNFFSNSWNKIKEIAANTPIGKAFNWVKDKIGKNYAGTNYWSGGLTTVAEKGAELIKIPGQATYLAQSKMLLDLPKGTEILNNSTTMKKLGEKRESLGNKLKSGFGLKERVINLKDKIQNLTNLGNTVSGDNITININANSGQNERELARLIRVEIEKIKNKKIRTSF